MFKVGDERSIREFWQAAGALAAVLTLIAVFILLGKG